MKWRDLPYRTKYGLIFGSPLIPAILLKPVIWIMYYSGIEIGDNGLALDLAVFYLGIIGLIGLLIGAFIGSYIDDKNKK